MGERTNSLGEEYPKEQARCRDLLQQYRAVGSSGAFGYAMIEQVLRRADKAAIEGDMVAMIRCFQEMQGCE